MNPDAQRPAEPAELPFPPAPVEELLRLFVKAVRTHQLYLPNNPVYKTAIDSVRGAFPPIWQHTDEVALTFTDTEVRWHGRPVLTESSKGSDSLPWTFHKDGVREVQLRAGFEDEELVRLFDILQRVRKASPDEDDLLTMLWEADFAYLRYRYVDVGSEGTAPLADGGAPVAAASPGDVRGAIASAAAAAPEHALVNMKDFDATLYFLDEKELQYLRAEIEREYRGELRRTVAATLFDIFEAQAHPEVRAEVAEHVEHLLLSLLATGDLRTVAYILAESQVAVERAANLTADQRERLGQLALRLSAPAPLGQLIQALDESLDIAVGPELTELFHQLHPSALGTILEWLPRLQRAGVRGIVEESAERLALRNTGELVQLVSSPNDVVAAEAIRRATNMKAPAAVPPLAKVLVDGTTSLRQLAVGALTAIGTPGALQALEKALDDDDREVRVAAVRTLGSKAYRGVFGRVEGAVKGKALRDADLTERMAWFEAYGAMCGEGGIAYLDDLLNGKGWFGARADSELRACAAMALGRIGGARATESLRKAVGEKDVVVRNAASRALRQGS